MLGIKLDPMQFLDRVGEELLRINDPGRRAGAWPTPSATATSIAAPCSSSATAAAAPTPPTSARTSARARSAARTSTTTPRNALRILSLTDNTPYILAWGNDEGFDRVFVEQLKNLAGPGDLLIAISGSGNSPNILRAVEWANQHGLTHLRLHRLRRRQAPHARPARPARAARRHGHRRIDPPDRVPLGRR